MVLLRSLAFFVLGVHLVRGTCEGCEDNNVLLQHPSKSHKTKMKRKLSRNSRKKVDASLVGAALDQTEDYTFEDSGRPEDPVNREELGELAVSAGCLLQDFCEDFGRYYKGQEYQKRKKIFEKQKEAIEAHNSRDSTFALGINEFTDWTVEELKTLRGLRKNRRKTGAVSSKAFKVGVDTSLPLSFDWREEGDVVSPVKNQGHCGSCWAFAATATVESAVAIADGFLTILAPQPMVSCAQNPRHCGGTGGCDGATAQIGFEFVMNHSLTYAEVVGYQSFWGETGECTAEMKGHIDAYPVVSVSGFVTNPTNDLEALMEALVTHGPQAISVDASHWSPYESGIADFCSITENIDIDHAVVLVGYGTDNGVGYWNVRNSWGTLWGEEGYIRLIRHEHEGTYCGWDTTPSHGSLCEDENVTQQYVCGTCGILFDTSYVLGARYVGIGSGDVNR